MSITYLGLDPINVTRFPDNTTQVWKLPEEWLKQERATLWWNYSHEGELLILAQLKDLFDANGMKNVYLNIEYLPFARQDKPISNDATFALHSFAKLLNSLEFTEVGICDPHSEVAVGLIKNSRPWYPVGSLNRAYNTTNSTLVCYPDKGARNKYDKLYNYRYIHGDKTRDQLSGYITGYDLRGDPEFQRVLIVDDICDGGATFVILARELYAREANEVNLFVSHGLFSKGLKPLFNAGIKRIFTKDGEAVIMPDGDFGIRKFDKDDVSLKRFQGMQ